MSDIRGYLYQRENVGASIVMVFHEEVETVHVIPGICVLLMIVDPFELVSLPLICP